MSSHQDQESDEEWTMDEATAAVCDAARYGDVEELNQLLEAFGSVVLQVPATPTSTREF
jgi:hypothetical protein